MQQWTRIHLGDYSIILALISKMSKWGTDPADRSARLDLQGVDQLL